MELDPSKFASSASMSLLGQNQRCLSCHRDLQPERHRHGGPQDRKRHDGTWKKLQGDCAATLEFFPPWDSRNKLTRSRSRTDSKDTTGDFVRPESSTWSEREERVTENGAVICERNRSISHGEGIVAMYSRQVLHTESSKRLKSSSITDWKMKFARKSKRRLLLRPTKRIAIAPWKESWSCFANFQMVHMMERKQGSLPNFQNTSEWTGPRPTGVATTHSTTTRWSSSSYIPLHRPKREQVEIETSRFRICPWCLKNTPSCLARCTFCFSVFISRGAYQRVRSQCRCSNGHFPMMLSHVLVRKLQMQSSMKASRWRMKPQREVDNDNDVAMGGDDVRTIAEPEGET